MEELLLLYDQPTGKTGPASFDPRDRGFNLGDGFFDTALQIDGKIVFGNEHLLRIRDWSKEFGFVDYEERLLRLYQQVRAIDGDCIVRTSFSSGVGTRGLPRPLGVSPTMVCQVNRFSRKYYFKPISLTLSEIRRNETSPTSGMKTLNYLDSVIAATAARTTGYDDAIFLNTQSQICCSTTANIFLVLGREVVTPPSESGVVKGVIRQWILKSATDFPFPIKERRLSIADLNKATSAFVTNSLRLIAPVDRIDERRLKPNCPEYGLIQSKLEKSVLGYSRLGVPQ